MTIKERKKKDILKIMIRDYSYKRKFEIDKM
jgi:hypothetical protein